MEKQEANALKAVSASYQQTLSVVIYIAQEAGRLHEMVERAAKENEEKLMQLQQTRELLDKQRKESRKLAEADKVSAELPIVELNTPSAGELAESHAKR